MEFKKRKKKKKGLTEWVNLETSGPNSLPSLGLKLTCIGVSLKWLSRLGLSKNIPDNK